MTDKLGTDLDATITAAVNARVEAEVAKALSGDATVGRFVTAALQQQVEVQRSNYRKERVTFLHEVLSKAIQEAAKEACRRVVQEQLPTIEAEVRAALFHSLDAIAQTFAHSLADAATKPYGVSVNLELKMPESFE